MLDALPERTRACYRHALDHLLAAEVPFLVGGAYAFERYTGIARHTKDFDLFIRREDLERVFAVLSRAGYHTELTFPHWLGKAFSGEDFIDVIFGSGNGVAVVDDGWFTNAVEEEVFGARVRLCPVEEMIWSKGFIMERERYDGADVAHLIRANVEKFDWRRLLDRFGPHWRVLFSHLVLFGFTYPAERDRVPAWVMQGMVERLKEETTSPTTDRVCQGTLVSRAQYLVDIDRWGYEDARLQPRGNMAAGDIAHWTAAIDD